MSGCPFDKETWAAVSVLSHKGWEDKPYSKLFCFDDPQNKQDEMIGLQRAQERHIPIVGMKINHYYPSVKDSFVTEDFPLVELQKKYNTFYFKNDASYMIAYAIHLGYKHLSLWGIDQSGIETYTMARPYVMFWLGVATGAGITWELCPTSQLLRKED